jgi:hypothetical protein
VHGPFVSYSDCECDEDFGNVCYRCEGLVVVLPLTLSESSSYESHFMFYNFVVRSKLRFADEFGGYYICSFWDVRCEFECFIF